MASAQDCLPEGILQPLVPQAADGWVEEWHNDSREHRDDLVVVEGIHGPGPCVGEESGRIVDGNHCQLRGASGEGSAASAGHRNPQEGCSYGSI